MGQLGSPVSGEQGYLFKRGCWAGNFIGVQAVQLREILGSKGLTTLTSRLHCRYPKILYVYIYIYLFIYDCAVSSLLLELFSSCSTQAFRCGGSCVEHRLEGAWALADAAHELVSCWSPGSKAQAQQLWCTGFVAPRHVGSSWTRDRTHVSCRGRQILNH